MHKPSGLATTAPAEGPCLTAWAEAERKEKLHPTSRLDLEVSGLVTFARTKDAISALRRARQEGRYGRGYLGLAGATPTPSAGEWTRAIAVDPRDRRLRIAVEPGAAGERVQEARTSYRVRDERSGCALLWLTPHTGRTHQLRVHASDHGAPLFGDVRYGGDRRRVLDDGRVVTARRTMLHCAWLRLPRVGEEGMHELSAAVPGDFARVWSALGGDAAALRPSPD